MVSGIKRSMREVADRVLFDSFLSDLGTCITSIPISLCGKKQKQAIAISITAIICKMPGPKKFNPVNPNISISAIKDNEVNAKSNVKMLPITILAGVSFFTFSACGLLSFLSLYNAILRDCLSRFSTLPPQARIISSAKTASGRRVLAIRFADVV